MSSRGFLTIAFAFLVAFLRVQPYKLRSHTNIATLAMSVPVLSMAYALAGLAEDAENARLKKRVEKGKGCPAHGATRAPRGPGAPTAETRN